MFGENPFAAAFSKIGQAATRVAFETRFHAIQNGMLRRLNKEIEAVTDDGTAQRIAALQKERDGIAETVPKIRRYNFGLITNRERFLEIRDDANGAVGAATSDGDADNFSAVEADNFNAAAEAVIEKIRNLKMLYYPGISDGGLVQRLAQEAEELEAYTAVSGVVDATGTDPMTNDNRNMLDLLDDISGHALIYSNSTNTLVGAASDMIIDYEAGLYGIEADMAEISAVELDKKEQQVEDLKMRYGNLLRAISLSFEVTSGYADYLADGVSPPPPEKGSILNLFT